MNMTKNKQTIEVVTVTQKRLRRWSAEEKAALIRETYEPGMSALLVARKHGTSASQLFNWRKLEREGALVAVHAGESVVPTSELAAAPAFADHRLARMAGQRPSWRTGTRHDDRGRGGTLRNGRRTSHHVGVLER